MTRQTGQKTAEKSINETRFSSAEKEDFEAELDAAQPEKSGEEKSLETILEAENEADESQSALNSNPENSDPQKKPDYEMPAKIVNTIKLQYDNLQAQLQQI